MTNQIAAIEKLNDAQIGEYVRQAVTKSAIQMWQAGRALAVVKKRLEGTDGWTTWLRTYWPLHERTAQRWIEVSEGVELKSLKEGQSITSAYKMLAEGKQKSAPKPAAGPVPEAGTAGVAVPRSAEVIEVTAPTPEEPDPMATVEATPEEQNPSPAETPLPAPAAVVPVEPTMTDDTTPAPLPTVSLTDILHAPEDRRESLLSRALTRAGVRMKARKILEVLEALEAEFLADLREREAEAAAVVGSGAN